jgi:hypothetical protein
MGAPLCPASLFLEVNNFFFELISFNYVGGKREMMVMLGPGWPACSPGVHSGKTWELAIEEEVVRNCS